MDQATRVAKLEAAHAAFHHVAKRRAFPAHARDSVQDAGEQDEANPKAGIHIKQLMWLEAEHAKALRQCRRPTGS